MNTPPMDESAIFAIERPAPKLFSYYLLSSFVLGEVDPNLWTGSRRF